MALIIFVSGLIVVSGIHAFAIAIGRRSNSRVHRLAVRVGWLGLVSLLLFVVACIDAFSQAWVKRDGYGAIFVIAFLALLAGLTILSFASILMCRRAAEKKGVRAIPMA